MALAAAVAPAAGQTPEPTSTPGLGTGPASTVEPEPTAFGDTWPMTITGTVRSEHLVAGGQSYAVANATDLVFRYVPGASDAVSARYDLESGTLTWTVDWTPGGGACESSKGHGTEPLVPDEAEIIGGEAGPGSPAESAWISVYAGDESQPGPLVALASAIVRLHGTVTHTGCDGSYEGDANVGFAPPSYWLQMPYGTAFTPRMVGRYAPQPHIIYDWDLTAQP